MPKYIERKKAIKIIEDIYHTTLILDSVKKIKLLPTIDPIAEIDKLIQDDMFISENKEYPLLEKLKLLLNK